MEPIQNNITTEHLKHYKPTEYEKERASNSYLMSVVAIIVGLPLPIINLLATALFFFGNLKSTKFVRWHCTQALLSQLTIFFINSIGYAWTLRIIFLENTTTSNSYFAYITVLIIFNLVELIVSIVLAMRVRKGEHVEWWLWGSITNSLFANGKRGVNIAQFTVKALILIILISGSYWGLKQLPWVETLKVDEFTAKKKEQLGNIILKAHRLNNREITGPIHPVIKKIKDDLCIANNIDTSSITLHVFADEVVNAFTIPGNHILINTGLIKFCKDPDMLAGVIAHEIGHIQNDHISKKLSKEIGIATLASLAGGSQNSGLIREIIKTLTSKKFDRDYEKEADASALQYLHIANIDPMPLADFFDKISDNGTPITEALTWVSTHPEPKERAIAIKLQRVDSKEYIKSVDEAVWVELQELVQLYDNI